MNGETPVADFIDRAAASLLQPPSRDMARLLAVVWHGYLVAGTWPVLDYVEGALHDYGLDVQQIMNEASSVGWGSVGVYASFWTPRGGLARNRDDAVSLTVLGTYHCGDHNLPYIDFFLRTLRTAARLFSETPIDPTTPRQCTYELDLGAVSSPDDGLFTSEMLWLMNVIDHEPTPWLGSRWRDAEKAEWQITRHIVPFADVKTMEQYLTVLVSMIARPLGAEVGAGPGSSLSLPEAIDYLDTVWELRFGDHLFQWAGATKTVELALPSASSEEFRSRVAALADLLNQMVIPGTSESVRNSSLQRLKAFARIKLSAAAVARIEEAIDRLRAIVAIRSGDAHHGARPRGARGFDALGIEYPPRDWGEAWQQVQSSAVAALNVIRQEVKSGASE